MEAKLVYDKELTDEGYYSTEPLLSVDSVLVSGPATEVNSVSHVYARAETDSFLTETKTYQTELNAVNDIGSQLHYLTFDNGNADITMTVPVYYSVEKPLSVSFKNSPTVYLSEPLEYTVTPSTVTAGVSGKEAADQMESIEVASIDFAELKPGKNTFSVSPADITGVNFKEETETIEITVEVKNCKTAEFTVPGANISFSNVAQNAAIDKPEKIDKVTIVGPESSLKELTAEDIYAAVDLTDYEEGSEAHRYPAKITVKGSGDCWAYGKYEISLP